MGFAAHAFHFGAKPDADAGCRSGARFEFSRMVRDHADILWNGVAGGVALEYPMAAHGGSFRGMADADRSPRVFSISQWRRPTAWCGHLADPSPVISMPEGSSGTERWRGRLVTRETIAVLVWITISAAFVPKPICNDIDRSGRI